MNKQLFGQLFRFGIVGVIAALIDFSVLTALCELLHTDVLWAAAAGFSVSVVLNYILSMKFVFQSKQENRVYEFILFVLLSIGGLLLNEVIMWLGAVVLPLHYLIAKIAATGFVTVYNFVTRKLFLENKEG